MRWRCAAAFLLFLFATGMAEAGQTIERIKARGILVCGVGLMRPGFADLDARGIWRGLDVDFCRAIAAVVLDDPARVRFQPLAAARRFSALQTGEVDVLMRNSTLTLGRDTQDGLRAVIPNFYDGHGFMLRAGNAEKGLAGLAGELVCLAPGSTNEGVARDVLGVRGIAFTQVPTTDPATTADALVQGRCQAVGADITALVGLRAMLPQPDAFVILPQAFSKEPLGPYIRDDDEDWFELIRWAVMALIEAEELGLNQANAEAQRRYSPVPQVRRLLGEEGAFGKALRVDPRWAYLMLRTVGNYGEIFDRNFGANSPFKLERGLNRLWTEGGLMYSWPIR